MNLWVVGEFVSDGWLMVGVFDTEELAVENCLHYNYFIGPVELNKPFPEKRCDWIGAYYPHGD